MPGEAGEYEIRYILQQGARTLATTPITIEEAEVTVTAPETAEMGSTIKVEWIGPDAQNDYIAIYPAGDDEAKYTSYTRTNKGSPLKLLMPGEAGDYEIRYVLYQGARTLAATPITIEEAEVTVTAPETAEMGSTIKVEWIGPDAQNDYIAIYPAGDDEAKYTSYTRTNKGNPLKLLMPGEAGDYEIRYVLYQGARTLATTPITIEEAEVSITAPETAELGSTIKIDWVGPDAQNDYIAIYPAGDDEAKYTAFTRTNRGNPLKLLMPDKTGDYEIRYVLYQGTRTLSTTPITITEPEVSLTVPDTATPGKLLTIEWVGPAQNGDYLAVANPEDSGRQFISSVRVKEGEPVKLRVPDDEGDYEIRYVLNQGKTIIARHPIKVASP